AIEDLDEAIRLDPRFADAYYQRGHVWMAKRDYDKAIRDYTEAIRLDSQDAIYYSSRGYAWASKKDFDKAIQDYTEAIRLAPQHSFAYSDLAWLLATCPEGKVRDGGRAIQLATRACELTGWQCGRELEVRAAAYAETGGVACAAVYQLLALNAY